MKYIPKDTKGWTAPSSVVAVQVEKETWPAKLPSENTPKDMITTEYFIRGTQPTQVSERYQTLNEITNPSVNVSGNKVIGYKENDYYAIATSSPMMMKCNDGYFVNLLNNHYIKFTNDIEKYSFSKEDINISKEHQCNIHVIKVISKNKIRIKSYEYGVGITSSCGSGAICSFYLCNMLDKVSHNCEIISDGGISYCEVNNDKYILKGNVSLIYKGELLL